jgi:hypothetical protein
VPSNPVPSMAMRSIMQTFLAGPSYIVRPTAVAITRNWPISSSNWSR